MLKITKEGKTITVTKGAFKEVYSHCGWVEVPENVATPAEKSYVASQRVSDSESVTTPKNSNSENYTPSDKDVLEGMSDEELRQYASLLGIKLKELKGREALMKAILEREV